jgi:hypothetical protein
MVIFPEPQRLKAADCNGLMSRLKPRPTKNLPTHDLAATTNLAATTPRIVLTAGIAEFKAA